jgi:hypothetical protein
MSMEEVMYTQEKKIRDWSVIIVGMECRKL